MVRGAGVFAWLDTLAASVAAVLMSFGGSSTTAGIDGFLSAPTPGRNVLFVLFVGTMWPVVCHLFGLYEARSIREPKSEAGRLVAATTAGSGLALVFLLSTGTASLASLPRFWLGALTLGLLFRTARRAVERSHRCNPRRALMIGTGPLARRAYKDLRLSKLYRYEVIGSLDDASSDHSVRDGIPPHIGGLEQLEQLLMRDVIDEVVIGLPVKSRYEQIQHVIRVCERAGVEAKYAADIFESTVAFPRYDLDDHRTFVAMQVAPGGWRLAIKRAIDIVGAAAVLLILSPLMLMVAAAIKVTSRGPIVFTQARCGLGRRPFQMYKFRSMFADADKLQAALEERNEASGPVFKIWDDPRITPLGRFLRKSSIDELPQLWNVLRGDMSLVGPRPLPWRDVKRITRPSDMRRFSMRPGITCLWQVQGRSHIGFERWVELDLDYIDRWSLAFDAEILVKTFPAVLNGKGAT
jgi:exopolysaccharide biosynthesis polyprenyl glycosylphosphotransferase